MKCDRCDNPATVHLIEIVNGEQVEKHLCELHAVEDGISVKVSHQPINELLQKFVEKHGGGAASEEQPLRCDLCGLSFEAFRKRGLLGCPNCYVAFKTQLDPLLERAHAGGTRHVGKVPVRAGDDQTRQMKLLQMRRELEEAVANEQYERAASLRDQLAHVEMNQG